MARRRERPLRPRVAPVTGLDGKGRALVALDGATAAVHGGLPGERVVVAVRDGGRLRAEKVISVRAPAPDRVVPRCPHYVVCGGCSLMHLDAGAQRALKQARLLARLADAGVAPERVLAPVVGPDWHYRRRARLGAKWVAPKGRALVGFRERGAPFVADMSGCHVLVAPVARLIAPLGRLLGTLEIRQRVPQVEVAAGDDRVALVLRVLDPPTDADLARLRAFEVEHGVALCLQPGGEESVRSLDGGPPPELEYALPAFDLRLRFGPLDFVQVNGELNRRLVTRAVELLDPQHDETVLELFCGLGNFSLALARRAGRVLGLEGSAALVTRAAANAASNGIGNAEFALRDLYGAGALELVEAGVRVDKVLVDPPRTGIGRALAPLAALRPRRLVYVSCNPETLASEAAELVRTHGYRLVAAGVADMFPHTAHAEALALFEA